MRKLIHNSVILLVLAWSVGIADAQLSLSLSSGSPAAGSTVALNLSLSTPPGSAPAALQWTLSYPSAAVTNVIVTAGPSATAAGKSVSCAAGKAGTYVCVAWGLNSNTMGGGVVAVATLTLSQGTTSVAVGVSGAAAASVAGTALIVTASGGSMTVAQAPAAPPVTVTSLSCSPATLGPAGSATCTVNLSAGAPAGGAVVTLQSNSASLTVPASVTVAAGAASAAFTATAGSIAAAQTAGVTAAWNGSSASASVALAPAVVTGLQCDASSLSPNTATVCMVTISGKAPAGGTAVSITVSGSKALTVPATVTVPANASSVSFPVAAGAITTAQTATLSAGAVSAGLALSATASGTLLSIQGDATELQGSTQGYAIYPAFAPASLTGKVVANGNGSVNLVIGSGVYFLNCCANTNNAYYQFTGAGVGSIFNISQGQVAFHLTSNYSFAQRQSTAAAKRVAFAVIDGNQKNQFYFLTQVVSQNLVFYYMTQGSAGFYYVPKGTEDQLFGKGVTLNVALAWNGATATLYLNGKQVSAAPYVPASASWTPAAIFDLGATEYGVFGGYNSSDDTIGGFSVTRQSSTSTVTAVRPAALALSRPAMANESGAPHAASAAGIFCSPNPVSAGSKALCEIPLGAGGAAEPAEIRLSSADGVSYPASVGVRAGQTKAWFEVDTNAGAAAGTVTLSAQLGSNGVEGSLEVTRDDAPLLRTPNGETGAPGTAIAFDVEAEDVTPVALSVSGLPAGATFDSSSGTFTWVPTASDLGTHTIVFSATNLPGRTRSQAVTVDVAAGGVDAAPRIFTVGESDQALAVRSGDAVLAAVPSAAYYGEPARPGDTLSILAGGIDCSQDPQTRNFQLRFGTAYAPIQSIQPAEGMPGVCQIAVQVPGGMSAPRLPISIETANAQGRVITSNRAVIAVEN